MVFHVVDCLANNDQSQMFAELLFSKFVVKQASDENRG